MEMEEEAGEREMEYERARVREQKKHWGKKKKTEEEKEEEKEEGWSTRGMSLFSLLSHTQMFGEKRRSRRRIGKRTWEQRSK